MQGCQHGLIECCTPSDGYYQGPRGAIYNGICPEALEPDFDFLKNDTWPREVDNTFTRKIFITKKAGTPAWLG
jgi:hypothetical protein